MKKLLFTCAAVAGVSLALGATAFADVAIGDVTETTNTTTASVATLPAGTGQMTVIVVKLAAPADGATSIATPTSISDNDIIYIDQDAYASGMFQSMGLKDTLSVGDYYMIRVGGENIAESGIVEEVYKVVSENTPDTYILGDVNNNGKPDGDDALQVLKYSVRLIDNFGVVPVKYGDINGNGNPDGDDALQILKYSVKLIDSLK